jgi:TRAP-type transport system periplasmic protein
MSFSRRALLKASAASAVLGGIGAPYVARAQQAEFTYKYANNAPDSHPMNVRAKEMAAAIKTETNGRFDLQIFPNNQLGSDTDMLSQIRSGGIEFFTLSGLILATLVPAASINGIGFAFPAKLNATLRGELEGKGLTFNQPDVAPFREKLRSAGFYSEWKGKYGDQAWTLLEKSVGKLS